MTQLLKRDGLSVARLVSMVSFVFGAAISVAGNVLAIRIPSQNAGPDWRPEAAAQLFAAVWPLSLLLAVEVLSRVPWPTRWYWRLAGSGGVAAVGLLSAVISFQHIRDLLRHWNYPALSSTAGPLVVDGLMVAAGFGLLAIAKARADRTHERTAVRQTHERTAGPDPAVRDAVWSTLPQAPRWTAPGPAVYVVPRHLLAPDQTTDQVVPVPQTGTGLAAVPTVPLLPRKRISAASRPRVAGTVQQTATLRTDEEIRSWVREQTGRPTKKVVMDRFSVGSSKALRLINDVKGPLSDG